MVIVLIDVLERITELRKERNWSEYQLAEKSGLTQSIISSWCRKDMLPTIPSLAKICAAFEISLSQFFREDIVDYVVSLDKKQVMLLERTSSLTNEQFDTLIHFLEMYKIEKADSNN